MLESLAARRLLLVGGKGGVGKTTLAAGLALAAARARPDRPVLALSIDPAHSLGDALGLALGDAPQPWPELPNLALRELDAAAVLGRFREADGAALAVLLERGTLLDAGEAAAFVRLSLPGLDELMALLELGRLLGEVPAGLLVVDTAPTGHTLAFLGLLDELGRWLDLFGQMQARHEAVAGGRGQRTGPDLSAALLGRLRGQLRTLAQTLRSPAAAFLPVALPEPLALAEAALLARAVRGHGLGAPLALLNRADTAERPPPPAPESPWAVVPELPGGPPPATAAAAARWWAGELHDGAAAPAAALPAPLPLDLRELAGAARLFLFCGKGGVGKTTLAAATALRLAELFPGEAHLVVSLDPAQALGRALGCELGAVPVEVAPGLRAQAFDACALLEAFRAELRGSFAALLRAMGGGGRGAGYEVSYDREILSGLLERTPPGIDELMALYEAHRLLAGPAACARLVLDLSPTGHFLRLLELPDLAQGWFDQLLRVLLRYKAVLPMAEAGEALLRLRRQVREVRAVLRDPAQTRAVLVARDGPTVVPETVRLAAALARQGLPAAALVHHAATGPTPPEFAGLAPRLGRTLRQPAPPLGTDGLRALGQALYP